MNRESPPLPGYIRVKIVFRGGNERVKDIMLRYFPRHNPVWGSCHFLFDHDERDYDWLVVYDDLPPAKSERFSTGQEFLACPRAHTLLVTTEPSTIKLYGSGYLSQFGHVLTSQEPWVIRHPNAIFAQPALLWFYGRESDHGAIDKMTLRPPEKKSALISTVCSDKQQTHTLHKTRYEFTQAIKARLPELDVFGHGVRPIKDKAEALDDYRYHLAIENHVCRHHWTEKLSDAFLGLCLPIYYGCPNVSDYFPADSFIAIDIRDVDGSARRIKSAIANGEYERRLPAIREARRLVLEQYGLFATVNAIVAKRHGATPNPQFAPANNLILSRRAWRSKPAYALAYALESSAHAARLRFPFLRGL